MRILIPITVLVLMSLPVACISGEPSEPAPLPPDGKRLSPDSPIFGQSTRLPVLPETPALGQSTRLPAATVSEPATPLPTATAAPTVTESPTIALPPAATELPPATEPPSATALPTPTPELEPALPAVAIGSARWTVELAVTGAEKAQGLSGRESLPAGAGMLFIYEEDLPLGFWMPDMHFPLDMVWINSDCRVVDVTLNALPQLPGQPRDELPIYSPREPARFVLEINAGEFEAAGISVGDAAMFKGPLAGQHGC